MAHNSLGDEKSSGQLPIISGCSHHDSDIASLDPKFERLLDGHFISLTIDQFTVPVSYNFDRSG
ncbi:MAG TPA: hypothetical protein VIL70_05940 [Chthoniobacterales bacterium]